MTLLDAPIELAGSWGDMLSASVLAVLERARHACLDGLRLVSDRQPAALRVDEHTAGPPAIWLHDEPRTTAWIIVDIGSRDWSKLAYQFGHELGHVLANSWRRDAVPAAPCQWLEEAAVEAFSLHGLARLADLWSRFPPFPNDSAFGAAVAVYRQNVVEQCGRLAEAQGQSGDFGAWFKAHRPAVEAPGGLHDFARAACLTLLAEYDRDPAAIEALGALNRWPERTGLPLDRYLRAWEDSCRQLSASPALPARLRQLLGPV